jgi:hypothetical protein
MQFKIKISALQVWQDGKFLHTSIVKPTRCTIHQIYFILKQHSTCFGLVSLSIIRSIRLYIQHQVYVIQVLLLLAVWQIPDTVCTVLTPDDGRGDRPKHVALFQNKINLRYCASGWFYYRNILRCSVLQTATSCIRDLGSVHDAAICPISEMKVCDANIYFYMLHWKHINKTHGLWGRQHSCLVLSHLSTSPRVTVSGKY